MSATHYAVPPGFDPGSVVIAFLVPNEMAGQRLDRFIHWKIPRLTRSRVASIVEKCACLVDGTRVSAAHRLSAKDVVLLVRERFTEPAAPETFAIVYEDAQLFIVNKPAGLPVHPSATYHKRTLSHLMRVHFARAASPTEPPHTKPPPTEPPQMAHRLDRETSGIVVCGKSPSDAVFLHRCFAAREVSKEYIAVVRGQMQNEQGVIEAYLRRRVAKDATPSNGELHTLMDICAPDDVGSLQARTEYRVLETRADMSRVLLFPHTGRQHQLRVHLAHIGHPIVGDKLYGPHGIAPFLATIDAGMSHGALVQLGHARHCLHAAAITIAHPRTRERMRFEAPVPDDIEQRWRDGLPF